MGKANALPYRTTVSAKPHTLTPPARTPRPGHAAPTLLFTGYSCGERCERAVGPGEPPCLLFAYSDRSGCSGESVDSNSHTSSSVRTHKAMAKMNSSFWDYGGGSGSDLLCGRPADYPFARGHFPMFVCSIIVLGGRWPFLNLIFPLPSEPSSVQKVISTTSKERGPMKL